MAASPSISAKRTGTPISGEVAGAKTCTVTSGPGFSLMMEHIGYAAITETPCVYINVQRAGPSTGLPTQPAQGDMMQARFGSHGDYRLIALCPNSPQECFDLTGEGFKLFEAKNGSMVPEMVKAGDGYRIHVTGLTHDERGYPAMNVPTHEKMQLRLQDKILENADKIVRWEEKDLEGADVVVVSYGITSR